MFYTAKIYPTELGEKFSRDVHFSARNEEEATRMLENLARHHTIRRNIAFTAYITKREK